MNTMQASQRYLKQKVLLMNCAFKGYKKRFFFPRLSRCKSSSSNSEFLHCSKTICMASYYLMVWSGLKCTVCMPDSKSWGNYLVFKSVLHSHPPTHRGMLAIRVVFPAVIMSGNLSTTQPFWSTTLAPRAHVPPSGIWYVVILINASF